MKYLILLVFFLFRLTACDTGGQSGFYEPPPEFNSIPVAHTGILLKVTPLNSAYAALCNNSGMSGNGERIHSHNNNPVDMYAGPKQDYIFDLGRIEQLGEVHIWNHNSGSGANGIKNVTVSYSGNNTDYMELGTFTLRQANGAARIPVTNLADDSIINFKGKSVRYIKISPIDNYGGGQYGLSEIKFYRYRNDVYRGAYIAASPIYRLNSDPAAEYYNLTNGAGLSDPSAPDAVHDNNPDHMYSVSGSSGTFEIDLQGRYPVEKIVVWNYNEPGRTGRGMKSIAISTSDDTVNWVPAGTHDIAEGTGENGLEPSAIISLNFTARYIRISGTSLGGTHSGLSAIRCYIGEGWYADNVPDFTALFSVYNQGIRGWTNADGIYSVNLDGKDYDPLRNPENKNTLFIFSDTLTTTVNPLNGERDGNWGMPNNTRATLIGGLPRSVNIHFNINPITINPPVSNTIYWLGDTFIVNNYLYIYTIRIRTGGTWGFSQTGTDLARFTITNNMVNESSLQRYNDTAGNRLYQTDAATEYYYTLGCAVLNNTAGAGALKPDGYIYVYGVFTVPIPGWGSDRRLVVARVKAENVQDFSKYEYLWSDNSWKLQAWGLNLSDPKFLTPSNQLNLAFEFSIHEIKSGPDAGKFMQVYMDTRFFDKWVRIRTANSPYGDFSGMQQIFFITDPFFTLPDDGSLYVYNGKAHTAVSPDNELYITYNVNGGDSEIKYMDIGRPRFIRYAQVPFKAGN
ncbi:MAG: discoidin domain-containing protein [Treponema sp.]|nr:discoidin domain-containing protein [Treponema sp.]